MDRPGSEQSMNAEQNHIDRVTKELADREPIFHRPEFGTTRRDFEQMMADDFWEVGASGQKYSREFVLSTLDRRHQSQVVENYTVTDFACRCVAQDSYLVTYQLEQAGGRLSRRATLWRASSTGWKIVYHQGTLIV
jgi:hypothetical protein